MTKFVGILGLCFVCSAVSAADIVPGTWPLPATKPWSKIVMAPQDPIKNEFTKAIEPLGYVVLGGSSGEPVVAIEGGTITFCSYQYSPTWRTVTSSSDLAEMRQILASMPEGDSAALNLSICVANAQGAEVWYSGLSCDQPLLKTGSRIKAGQVLGTLGSCFPRLGPSLSLQGSTSAGTNRILTLLRSPFPLLPIVKPRSVTDTVSGDLLRDDLRRFWMSLKTYYPGLYDATSPDELESAISRLSRAIPKGGLSINEFTIQLRTLMRLFSDNHMSVRAPHNPKDTLFLPIELGVVSDKLFVTASRVGSIPVGAEITSLDGRRTPQVIETLWTQGGRSDGSLGTWERETLSHNAGSLWVSVSGKRSGDQVKMSLVDGSSVLVTVSRQRSVDFGDWWEESLQRVKARGQPIPGVPDTANLVVRRISSEVDAVTLYSFDLSDLERTEINHYLSGKTVALPAHLIIDLRTNPGGEEATEWEILGNFNSRTIRPFEVKSVLHKAHPINGTADNLVGGDQSMFDGYTETQNGDYQRAADSADDIPVGENPYLGQVLVLTGGMTGSAAFDAARILQRNCHALLIGRPGPHGVNRMIAEKFAQVYLPNSGVSVQIPLVKIATQPGGLVGPPVPLTIDYPVEITLDAVTGKRDPEWEKAIAVIGAKDR